MSPTYDFPDRSQSQGSCFGFLWRDRIARLARYRSDSVCQSRCEANLHSVVFLNTGNLVHIDGKHGITSHASDAQCYTVFSEDSDHAAQSLVRAYCKVICWCLVLHILVR